MMCTDNLRAYVPTSDGVETERRTIESDVPTNHGELETDVSEQRMQAADGIITHQFN